MKLPVSRSKREWTLPALAMAGSLFMSGASAAASGIKVIAHRGEHLHHVENTLPAFQAAIDAGADYFECDVRTTSDGHLVLMHDPSVDRTTNGKGRIHDLTFAQIRSLSAGGNPVPTFSEALELAKGHIGVYVDDKETKPAALIQEIDQAGMGESVVLYVSPSAAKEILAWRPDWRVMPEAGNASRLQQLIDSLHLRVAAFDESDFKPETIGIARQHGVEIYVDRLGRFDTESGWQSAIDAGASGIQTDHPAELVGYCARRALHR